MSLRGVPEIKLEHESYPECQIAACLRVYCANLAEMRHGGGVLFAQQVGSCSVQQDKVTLHMSRTLPGRQEAPMFLSSFTSNDAALVVKHSSSQSH